MAKTLVVTSRVKELAKIGDKQLQVSTQLRPILEAELTRLIKNACRRALANKRNTVQPRDF